MYVIRVIIFESSSVFFLGRHHFYHFNVHIPYAQLRLKTSFFSLAPPSLHLEVPTNQTPQTSPSGSRGLFHGPDPAGGGVEPPEGTRRTLPVRHFIG